MNFFPVSTFTKGEQMIPVLNKIGTHCAVFGNHDFGKFEWFNLKIFAFAIICSGRMKGILKSSSKLGLKIKEVHKRTSRDIWVLSYLVMLL